MLIKGYAAYEAGGQLAPFEYEPASLGPHEVILEVSHCGICHSDVHIIDNDWRDNFYPFVPGHEIVGRIKEKGESVGRLNIGQLVGVGWQAGACLECEMCVSGQENLCRQSEATCAGRHGGFADHVVVDSRFAFPLPDSLRPDGMAPLLCGGITVFSPLHRYEVRPWHKVGVVGIGGLGHMALQFARSFGCEVTAFSSSESKEDEAKELGAKHFVHTKERTWERPARNSQDFILVTATADLDWTPYIKALRPNGMLCFVTGESTRINVPVSMLLGSQRAVSGSLIGGRNMMAEMIQFASRSGVRAQTEILPLSDVNLAIEKVRKNQARYRMVLEV